MIVSEHSVLLVHPLIIIPISLLNPVVSLERFEKDMAVHYTFILDWTPRITIRSGTLLSAVYRDHGKCDTGVFLLPHMAWHAGLRPGGNDSP